MTKPIEEILADFVYKIDNAGVTLEKSLGPKTGLDYAVCFNNRSAYRLREALDKAARMCADMHDPDSAVNMDWKREYDGLLDELASKDNQIKELIAELDEIRSKIIL